MGVGFDLFLEVYNLCEIRVFDYLCIALAAVPGPVLVVVGLDGVARDKAVHAGPAFAPGSGGCVPARFLCQELAFITAMLLGSLRLIFLQNFYRKPKNCY